jgi:hypothetical protein
MQAEFSYLKLNKPNSKSDVNCELCHSSFSIANKGRSAIRNHLESAKHRKAIIDTVYTEA